MTRKPLWKVTIATTAEAEDAIGEALSCAVGQAVASYTDLETGRAYVTAYLDKPPAQSSGWRRELRIRLREIKACGLKVGRGTVTVAKVRRQDWAESWKRHFRPLRIGSALVVRPSWSRLKPGKGQHVVVLDPGLSFGTGQHPTTAFCLQQLVKRRRAGKPQSFLDIGTGSGILAIAALKLGYNPVEAFDFDPEAVRVARANARQNGVADRIRITRQDLTKLPVGATRRHAVVCANLLSNLLLAERKRILARLAPAGVLVVAGILKQEFSAVQAAYEAAGLRLAASRGQREWRSGAFVRRRPD
jgi:ribosomal protein L11 methyltransferase